jgi:hypothetical protein
MAVMSTLVTSNVRTGRASGAFVVGSSLLFLLGLACGTPQVAPTGQFPVPEERLAKYGLVLTKPVQVIVHQSIEDFRAATGKNDPRYRAWTKFDVVHLYGPVSDDRLTHELCHAAIHQAFGSVDRATRAQIPRFFEEGVCAIVGAQQATRMKRTELITLNPEMPLDVKTYDSDPEVAYAAALHTMQLVIDQHGREAIGEILRKAALDGSPGCVEKAMKELTGSDPPDLWKRVVERG